MMPVVNISRSSDGKFIGTVDGKVVVRSSSKYYVERKLGEYKEVETQQQQKESKYSINDRFDFVEQMVDLVASRQIPSAVITGEGGLGKSYTVVRSLENAGLKNVTDLAGFEIGERIMLRTSYRIVKGFSTAKGLYRTLFESNGMTVVFDDCDSVLKDPVALNLLKGALDSFDKRYISWNADMRDDDLPRTFEFTGSAIFISNRPMDSIDQAIRTRCMCVDLTMNTEQKLQRMEVISQSEEFLPQISEQSKRKALVFLKQHINAIPNLSLRSLIQTCKICQSGKKNWEQLAEYILTEGN